MGTRNLTLVVVGKKIKVAQYGQWDGNPGGVGEDVVKFIRKTLKTSNSVKIITDKDLSVEKFKESVAACSWATPKEITKLWESVGAKGGSATMEQADKLEKAHPEFSRNTSSGVLGLIHKKGGMKLQDSSNFAADSLFCEWAYLLDLDKKVLEVYKGFNKEKLTKKDRFFKMKNKEAGPNGKEYEPIKLFKAIPFDKLTSKTMAAIEKEASKENEE